MTIPIKLTADDIQPQNLRSSCCWLEVDIHSKTHSDFEGDDTESRYNKLESDNRTKAAQLQQQILENQEIVDIVKLWAQTEPITMSDGIKLTPKEVRIRGGPVHHLINLIRNKTGITITKRKNK